MSRSSRIILGIVIVIILISTLGIFLYKFKVLDKTGDIDDEHKLPAIKIILTNGCGFEGLAKEFSEFLDEKNVDVIAIGNTRRPVYDKTIIVIRKGDNEDLRRLQRMTGITRFTMARTESALAEFEIIIGKDYEQYIKK